MQNEEILSEKQFCKMMEEASKDFFKIYNYLIIENGQLTRKFYSTVMYVTETFESFLDEHGARRNKSWIFFAEIVASIRNLAVAAFHLRHILNRYTFYNLEETKPDKEGFHKKAYTVMLFLDKSTVTLFLAAKKELDRHKFTITTECYDSNNLKDISKFLQLERNADEEKVLNSEERIAEFSRRYRKAAKMAKIENFDHILTSEEMLKIIPLKINENKVQKLKNMIHGTLSDYDTYVRSTTVERKNGNFIKLRGYISIPYHLLIVVSMLSHFYERHENDIRHGETKEKIAELIDKNKILDGTLNFAFYYCNKYLQKGNLIAEALLTTFTKKVQYELPIPHPLGFHARPATYISLIVNEHGTDVFLKVDSKKFNAKSVLNLMEAGGLISDNDMKTVIFEGDKRVLDDLRILATHNYCEDQEIPRELNYIRILRNVD